MELHTDGNAIAGILEEVFCAEMTAARRVCASCRRENPVGSHLLYESAGFVLRCPSCGDVAAAIVALPNEYAVSIRGTWTVSRAE
jgi:uncharacterized Zn finger protein